MKYLPLYLLFLISFSLKGQELSEEVRAMHNFTSAERFMYVWDSIASSGSSYFGANVQAWQAPADYFFEITRDSANPDLAFRIQYPVAYIWHTLARFDDCIPLFVNLLAHEDKIPERWRLLASLKLEEAYRRTGNLKEAIPIRKKRIEWGYAHNFWEIYAEADLFSEAIRDFKETVKEPIKGWNRMQFFMQLASLYEQKEEYDSAISYYQKAYQDGKFISNKTAYDAVSGYSEANKYFWTAYCQGMIGRIWVKQGRYSEAIPNLKEDIKMSGTVGEVDNTLPKRLDLATCYLNLGQPEIAKSYLDTVKRLMVGRGWIDTKMQMLEVESDYFFKTNQFSKAATYLKKFNHLKDSIDLVNNKNSLIAMTALLDSDKQRAALAEQQLKLEQANSEKESQRNQLNLLFSGLFILILLLIIVYSSNRQKSKSKAIAEQRLEEKETFLKELHHRVKNNLQVTSGLLQLQADKSNDAFVHSALNESKGRIKSMALIHNLLLNDDTISSISIKHYIEELIQLIAMGYGGKNIEVSTNISDLTLKAEMAVPIGLIINEILTNSYKYAFDDDSGKIAINFDQFQQGGGRLEIRDNGKGFPKEFDVNQSQSLGMQLITMLCGQIRAKLDIFSNQGAVYIIDLPKH